MNLRLLQKYYTKINKDIMQDYVHKLILPHSYPFSPVAKNLSLTSV